MIVLHQSIRNEIHIEVRIKMQKRIIYYLRFLVQLLHHYFLQLFTPQVSTSFNRLSNRSNRLFHAEAYTQSNEFD